MHAALQNLDGNAPHLEEVVSILITLNPNRPSFVYVQVVSIDVSDRL